MIWIDDRKGSKEILPKLRTGIPSTLTHLEYADAAFNGNGPDGSLITIGIERKVINDLVNSIISGRLTSHQLVGLLRTYQYTYLLVEGIFRSNPRTGVLEHHRHGIWKPLLVGRSRRFMGRAVNNYLNRLAILYNIKIAHTSNLTQTGFWLSDIYSWWTKPWDDHDATAGFYISPMPPRKLEDGSPVPIADLVEPPFIQRVIKEFKGIGWRKSQLVMEHFPTMESLVKANRGHLRKVPKIGKGLADSMYKEMRGQK